MMSELEPTPRPKKTAHRKTQADAANDDNSTYLMRGSSSRPFKLLHAAFLSPKTPKKIALARALGAWSVVHGMSALIIDGHPAVPEGMDAVDLFRAAVGPSR